MSEIKFAIGSQIKFTNVSKIKLTVLTGIMLTINSKSKLANTSKIKFAEVTEPKPATNKTNPVYEQFPNGTYGTWGSKVGDDCLKLMKH